MINTNPQKIEEVLNRGVDEIIEKENLLKKMQSGKQLRVKFGVDPTSPDLHLGHSIPLRKLRQFQNLGHKVILLIGDFTATIGDPSGRTTQRPQLSAKEVKKNMKDYIKQAGKILDIKKTEIRYNNEWYKNKGAQFLMELSSKFTLARVAERDDFKKRIKEDVDISMLELLYPLLQGYDSVELKSDVEVGGRDQKFNLLMGRKVQKRYDMPEQDIMTFPLLEGIGGVKKMSKSLGNYIGLTEAPENMYGKIMSVSDELMWKYFNLLTDVSTEEIEKMKNDKQKLLISPIEIKQRLAKEIVKMYHGENAASMAEENFNKVFRQHQAPDEMPILEIPSGSYNIVDLLCLPAGRQATSLAESKNDAKRVIEGNGVEIDNEKITDWKKEIEIRNGMIIKFGKRKFIKIHLVK